MVVPGEADPVVLEEAAWEILRMMRWAALVAVNSAAPLVADLVALEEVGSAALEVVRLSALAAVNSVVL